jgi:hypothetical protein
MRHARGKSSLLRASARILALGTALLLSACATPEELAAQQGDQLAAAGFIQRPANTPERQAMLHRLPANSFVREVNGDQVTYVFADPLVCNCLYVGTQDAYSRYQQYVQAKRLVEEQRATAMLYSDPAWNWGAWGPWGPGFGFRGYGW